MLSAQLILVRHGQSTYNAEHRLQGQADPPLSELGRREAAALAPALAGFPAERVLVSDLRRARETAELAGYAGARPEARWREIDVGEWQGRKIVELPPGAEPSWRGGEVTPPGGETWDEFEARIADGLDELVAAGGPWMVVCHGGVVRAAVSYLTAGDARRLAGPANGSVSVFHPGEPAHLLAYAWTPDGAVPGLHLSDH
jgi:glucosyl-3-phosphoglycerate phosphatase